MALSFWPISLKTQCSSCLSLLRRRAAQELGESGVAAVGVVAAAAVAAGEGETTTRISSFSWLLKKESVLADFFDHNVFKKTCLFPLCSLCLSFGTYDTLTPP